MFCAYVSGPSCLSYSVATIFIAIYKNESRTNTWGMKGWRRRDRVRLWSISWLQQQTSIVILPQRTFKLPRTRTSLWCMCVGCAHVCICAWGGLGLTAGASPNAPHFHYPGRVSHWSYSLPNLANVSVQLAPGIPLIVSQWWDYVTLMPARLLCGPWGSELRSPCLLAKYFSPRASPQT